MQSLLKYDFSDLSLLDQQELGAEQTQTSELSRAAAVINTTDADNIFTLENLRKLRANESDVPK